MILSNEYIAGFFDADGSIGVYARNNRKCYQVCVAIANSGKHGEIICKELKDRYGGTVTYCKNKKSSHRPVFWWRINGAYVVEHFILDIVNYSIIKKDQLKLCLEYIRNWKKFPKRKTEQQKEYAYKVTEELK